MTTQYEERNPFPEPQTIPSGWDMSAFLSAPKPIEVNNSDEEDKNVNK